MATVKEEPASTSTELAVISGLNPVDVFKPGGLDKVLATIDATVKAMPPVDISTEKGRKECASRAAKIARSKSYIDKMGKDHGEELRKNLNGINAERKRGVDFLQALQDEVRAPLTAYEKAEEARIAAHDKTLDDIEQAAEHTQINCLTLTVDAMQREKKEIEALLSRPWDEFSDKATVTISKALATIDQCIAKREAHLLEQAELARLRQEAADREQKEREERIAAEAAEKAKADEERKRVEAEERAARAEAEKAEAEARAERERVEAEANAKAREEAAAQAERDRIAAEQKAEADAAAKREANQRHRNKIHKEVSTAIAEAFKVSGDIEHLVLRMAAGDIPHVSITY